MSKKYKVEMTYTFKGYYIIVADSKEEAKEYAEKHCGMVYHQEIYTVR